MLLGLRIGDEGPEAFSVDPSNGVLCVNPRCIPEDEWLASEDYAQEQIAVRAPHNMDYPPTRWP